MTVQVNTTAVAATTQAAPAAPAQQTGQLAGMTVMIGMPPHLRSTGSGVAHAIKTALADIADFVGVPKYRARGDERRAHVELNQCMQKVLDELATPSPTNLHQLNFDLNRTRNYFTDQNDFHARIEQQLDHRLNGLSDTQLKTAIGNMAGYPPTTEDSILEEKMVDLLVARSFDASKDELLDRLRDCPKLQLQNATGQKFTGRTAIEEAERVFRALADDCNIAGDWQRTAFVNDRLRDLFARLSPQELGEAVRNMGAADLEKLETPPPGGLQAVRDEIVLRLPRLTAEAKRIADTLATDENALSEKPTEFARGVEAVHRMMAEAQDMARIFDQDPVEFETHAARLESALRAQERPGHADLAKLDLEDLGSLTRALYRAMTEQERMDGALLRKCGGGFTARIQHDSWRP